VATPPGPLRFQNLVFDLDGTLVDSLPGIEASLRAALAARHPDRELAEGSLRPLVGPQLPLMLAALWPDLRAAEIAALAAAYRRDYLAGNCANTAAFPGVTDLLAEFHRAGATLFLLTNKPRVMTQMILSRQGWTGLFREIGCPDDERHPFADKAAGAVALRERHALAPASTLLVGDALDDAQAAAAAGFAFVRAAYGYGHAVGHGSSSREMAAGIGAFAELRPFVFSQAVNPAPDDHPQPLR
jgi:phosphoglycolate phosphatase